MSESPVSEIIKITDVLLTFSCSQCYKTLVKLKTAIYTMFIRWPKKSTRAAFR